MFVQAVISLFLIKKSEWDGDDLKQDKTPNHPVCGSKHYFESLDYKRNHTSFEIIIFLKSSNTW